MTAPRTILLAALVAALQIGLLGWSIMGRAAVLRYGKEALVKVEPVDPRDLLRGDYVRLGYEMRTIPVSLFENPPEAGRNFTGVPIWVRLEKQADQLWKPISASIDAPLATPAGDNQADIAGRGAESWTSGPDQLRQSITVDYGIERFYLPEGEGLQIEKDMRERPFFVKLAVAADGAAQIKQLLDGDKLLYEEPPY